MRVGSLASDNARLPVGIWLTQQSRKDVREPRAGVELAACHLVLAGNGRKLKRTMTAMVPEEDAKEAALSLWSALRASSVETGVRVDKAALQFASTAMGALRVHPEGGATTDHWATGPWHAACCLLFADIVGRSFPEGPPSDRRALEAVARRRLIYRGQARAWPVQPTGWRESFPTARALEAMHAFLAEFMGEDDDIELDLVGRFRSVKDVEGLAQHYGIPTSLVDFSFDPLVAVFFALSHASSSTAARVEPVDHAVVYYTNVYRVAALSQFHLSFPPIRAQRLYRQSGLFVDYGTTPKDRSVDAEWAAIEQNCVRLFFPRSYPVDPQSELFDASVLLTPEPFLEQVAWAAREVAEPEQGGPDSLSRMHALVTERPPWRTADLDGGGLYTDDDLLAIGQALASYVHVAALLQGDDLAFLDPFVLRLLLDSDERILKAIHELSHVADWVPATSLQALGPVAAAIRESVLGAQQAMQRFPQ